MSLSNIKEYLNSISKEDVIRAMEILDNTDLPSNRQSLAYDVLKKDSDKTYPPPLLIEYAYKISNKGNLPQGFFDKIGKKSPHFKKLKDLGFKIITKNEKAMGNLKAIFKKVPMNEVGAGTEIAILKTYFNKNLIDDPKDFSGSDDNDGSKSFPINVTFNNHRYIYPIKAYKTSNYKKDRRLILNKSNDPLGLIRKPDDYLCFVFNDKISRNSEVEIYVINEANPLYKNIDELYANKNGLILEESENSDLLNLIIGKKVNSTIINQPLNQILYGPPGTGKTYSTITKALNIIGLLEEKDNYTKEEYEEAQELFQNELGKRIEFVTMHQSFSYEDFVQGLKPFPSENGNGVVFKYKNGVFKEITKRAEEFRTGDSSIDIKQINNKDICKIGFFLAKYNGKKKGEKKANDFLGFDSDNNAFIGIGEKINENPNSIKNHRDKFDYMFSDRKNYTSRNGWTPRNNDGVLDNTTKWPYREIFDELKNNGFEENSKIIKGLLTSNSKPIEVSHNNEKFVIILDEINRANISRVFGELIALIEKDKRDGKLTATLPSGEPFTVPANLHIIGTMNTADKSIALVDIALRRRFEFTPLYPDTDILKQVLLEKNMDGKEIDLRVNLLSNLNRIIRAKKSVDFEIGHSYFMDSASLKNIMNKQVLPLLNEYFMYDLRKVKEIIEKPQKDKENNSIPKLGIILNKNLWETRGLLEVENLSPTMVEIAKTEIVQETTAV
jgi:hypothetical protein